METKKNRGVVKKKNCKICSAEFEGNSSAAKCPKCSAEYQRQWKVNNREKIDAYNTKFRENNAQYLREYKQQYRLNNPEKTREWVRAWKERHPDRVLAAGKRQDAKRGKTQKRKAYMKDKRLKKHFDITLETYNQLLLLQNGVCAICRKPETHLDRAGLPRQLCVDHCHKTGVVRQLLCNRCNAMLGRAEDDIERLKLAAAYLEKHSKK